MKQIIYFLKPNKNLLFKKYPILNNYLIKLKPTNTYLNQQLDLLLHNTSEYSTFFYSNLYQRSDYKKQGNKHVITNLFQNDTIICNIHEYYIEIISKQKSNTFSELICHKTKNYVIIYETD